MKKTVAVIGASEATAEEVALAREMGKLIAQAGLVLVSGGLGGVMAAACEGAKSAGGLTVGILPMREKKHANLYVDIAIPTAMSEARNLVVVLSGDAVVAIGGGFGTLSEIALALRAGTLVVALSSWNLDPERIEGAPFIRAATPQEAMELILREMARPK
jgi:uncharacterized protein (TIGR00725 family)